MIAGEEIDCQSTGTPDNLAKVETIKEGIDYLNGLSGAPTAEAGKCNRVSCSYGSGITVCSDVSLISNSRIVEIADESTGWQGPPP